MITQAFLHLGKGNAWTQIRAATLSSAMFSLGYALGKTKTCEVKTLSLCQQGYPICRVSCLVLGRPAALRLIHYLGKKQKYPCWHCCSVVAWGAVSPGFPPCPCSILHCREKLTAIAEIEKGKKCVNTEKVNWRSYRWAWDSRDSGATWKEFNSVAEVTIH